MKKQNIFIVTLIVVLLMSILFCYNLLLHNQLKECNNKEPLNNEVTNDKNKKEILININDKIDYDCSFTVTYRVVDMLDGYIAEVPEYSYVVVDKFQVHGAIAHFIPTELKRQLEINKYYEFTYQVKGKGNINDIYDVINNISIDHYENDNLSVVLSIRETDKVGLEQVQENICK